MIHFYLEPFSQGTGLIGYDKDEPAASRGATVGAGAVMRPGGSEDMRVVPYAVQVPAALMVAYLDLLSVAALCRRSATPACEPRNRIAVLIPAHDEEILLPRLLQSLAAVDYPPDLFRVYVVADNCEDGTADVARRYGACTFERHDDAARAKGYALRWLLERIGESGERYDAFAVVDADTVVSMNFLRVLDSHLQSGDQAVQVYYGVLNKDESWPAMMRWTALALYNGLRPRGRDALGLSAGLRGNGMCFAAPVLERFGWGAFTLAEDSEFHLQLVAGGVRVAYSPEATVLAEMPVTLRQSRSQNLRWERGRLQLLRTHGWGLLASGVRHRDPVRLEALAEQLVPPLSVLTAVTSATLAATALQSRIGPRRLATAVVLGQAGYVFSGLALAGARPRAYLSLLFSPLYAAWKVWVYLLAALHLRDDRWVRTGRRAG
jgi:1,2-diacylglycerol 3-beta-glucosyltransferase